MSYEDVLKRAENDGIKFIYLQFTDMFGTVKNVTIPVEKLPEALERGIWFDGSSIEGFVRIHESDLFLKPDTETYAVIPWEERDEKTARFICDVFRPDGKPFEGDPRHILKKAVSEINGMGLEYYVGPELEFFIFRKENGNITPVTHDKAGYFDFSSDLASNIRKDMTLCMEQMGISIEASHHEVAWGQHEIDFRYGKAVATADNAITFKFIVKAIAAKYGLYATFMPKPIQGINGSGMHVHQSLFNMKTEKNVFFDSKDRYKLSEMAYSFIAGQMQHIKGMSAILSPTVNSYKRLLPGYEAACYISWAQINRSALIRIPRYSPGREDSTRCELRCPDPSCNPYLAFAVMLKAGIDGIKKGMKPPEPVEENVFDFDDSKLAERNIEVLPYSLIDAVKEMRKNEVVKETLGNYLFSKYIDAKMEEWDSFRISVTDWETKRYLEKT
ncbi:MAG: type I glutamate--ammonia ligase [Candidatus Aenigmarchaeota archaeon]|nr:type I glutamate--ammonia ligase [Candidatus Aenigmarchaeota archaeon]